MQKNLSTVNIVVFNNHVTNLVKSKNIEVNILPRNLENAEKEIALREKKRKAREDVKEAAQQIMKNNYKTE